MNFKWLFMKFSKREFTRGICSLNWLNKRGLKKAD